VTPLKESDADVQRIDCHYPLIHSSNALPYHFVHGFRLFLNGELDLQIRPHAFRGDIHVRDEERNWLSQVDEITGSANTRFWIVVSGGKSDFTTKWWDPQRYQAVVDHFRGGLLFVQVGEVSPGHVHPPLDGVIDLIGKTDLRQLIRLVYHSDGVVCPVTFMMHAAAAVPTRPGRPMNRACVVVAGGREPPQWEAYPHHQYLHVNGSLPCCDNGGCWKSRTVPLGDGDEKDLSLCELPVRLRPDRTIPKCLDMIGDHDVIRAIERYLEFDAQRHELRAATSASQAAGPVACDPDGIPAGSNCRSRRDVPDCPTPA
jgi:ADP-heptose:LPS heptosyltransferase